ncbi:MAG: hypothetical protein F6K42_30625, partial [Leptolyngbya sp. SIO1D8]|nr:hypothetical protein [Leptolyngbya sp. SIO1D8]
MTSFNPSDPPPTLEDLSAQLNSPNLKTRILAMLELQKESMPAQAAYLLIQQALHDTAEQ